MPVCYPLTYYMSELIHNLPVLKEEIEQISILQKFKETHVSIISTQYNLDTHPADVHVHPI